MAAPRIGFVTGHPARWRKHALAAKYRIMRARGLIYPDVYAIPYFLADRFDFIRQGERISRGRYDLVISELNRGDRQLEYLDSLIATGACPVAIIPGPPELLVGSLTEERSARVRRILEGAACVWAYSEPVKSFVDGFLGRERSRLIPWPFHSAQTRRLGGAVKRSAAGEIRVLLNAPLRFTGPCENQPMALRAAVQDGLSRLAPADRARFRLSTFLYSDADREAFREARFSEGLGVQVEKKRSYAAFVRFIGRLDGVINLTTGGVLGRITFLAAALGRPGLFSDNSEINRALYPGAVVGGGEGRLGDRTATLLEGLARGAVPEENAPSVAAVEVLGDFRANAAVFRQIVEADA